MAKKLASELFEVKPKCFVFDIDGCLADINDILIPNEKGKIDWDYYSEHLKEAKPYYPVIDLLVAMAYTTNVIILTGRKEKHRVDTIQWLSSAIINRHGESAWRRCNFQLKMRPEKDNDKSVVYKKKQVEIIEKDFAIQLFIEDHPEIVEMLTQKGYMVLRPNTIMKTFPKNGPVIDVEILDTPVDLSIDTGVKENAIVI